VSVRIRLRRMGAKKKPFYRVVVADSRSPRDGRFLDTIGTYDPRIEPAAVRIDREKTLRWLGEGAMPTDSARSLLSQAGIWQEYKTGVRPEPRVEEPAPKKAPAKAEAPVAEGPVADAPVADEPVADEPVADEPAADAPMTEAPAEESSAASEAEAPEAPEPPETPSPEAPEPPAEEAPEPAAEEQREE